MRQETANLNISLQRMGILNLLSIVIYFVSAYAATKNVDVKKSLVFGPAFDPDIVLPVRYFYIQLVDKKGKKYVNVLIIVSLIVPCVLYFVVPLYGLQKANCSLFSQRNVRTAFCSISSGSGTVKGWRLNNDDTSQILSRINMNVY